MGRFEQLTTRASLFIEALRNGDFTVKDKAKDYGGRILRPKKFEKYTEGGEDRAMQILSLCLVPVVIVVSLVMIVALNEVLSEIFGISEVQESQSGLIGWFVTAVTGGAFLLAAWSWFQFVRTYGFGIFRW